MKKIHVIGLALCAVFACSAFAASSAFAGSEWLLSGEPLAAQTSVESEGELLLCDDKGGIAGEAVCIHCSGLNAGFVGPTNLDEITDITNLAGTSLDITDCTNDENCTTVDLVEGQNFPWKTELVLMTNGEILDLLIGGGYEVVCLVLGVEVKDVCKAEDLELGVENMAAEKDVLLLFSATELGVGNTCTRGGANQGLTIGEILVFSLTAGLELSVSVT